LGGEVRIGNQAVDEFDDSMHLTVWHLTDSPVKLSPVRYCEKLRRASRFLLISTEKPLPRVGEAPTRGFEMDPLRGKEPKDKVASTEKSQLMLPVLRKWRARIILSFSAGFCRLLKLCVDGVQITHI
jgi:hypothetical protein